MTATVEGRPLLVLADVTSLTVRAELNQIDFARVHAGQHVRITFDSIGGKVFAGEVVARAASSVRGTTGTEVLPVQIRILPAKELAAVMPGMSADVEIDVARKTGVLLLPIEAVIVEGTTKTVLAWSEASRRYEPRVVHTGEFDDHRLEILDGVSEGLRVQLGANVSPVASKPGS
jgi:multidrug efflux pump subunit AcrA (membrane-fusion protein)